MAWTSIANLTGPQGEQGPQGPQGPPGDDADVTEHEQAANPHPQYASASHTHNASDVNAGTLNINRIPTGTSSSTVALGNHTHSGYAPSSHSHTAGDITSGSLSIARIPTGTSSSTVALGNHTHSDHTKVLAYYSRTTSSSGSTGSEDRKSVV